VKEWLSKLHGQMEYHIRIYSGNYHMGNLIVRKFAKYLKSLQMIELSFSLAPPVRNLP
jgi:hypothetical protein